jgi:hypothetical protein
MNNALREYVENLAQQHTSIIDDEALIAALADRVEKRLSSRLRG